MSSDDSYTFNVDWKNKQLTVRGKNLEFRDALLLLLAVVLIVGFLTGSISL